MDSIRRGKTVEVTQTPKTGLPGEWIRGRRSSSTYVVRTGTSDRFISPCFLRWYWTKCLRDENESTMSTVQSRVTRLRVSVDWSRHEERRKEDVLETPDQVRGNKNRRRGVKGRLN